MASVQLRQLAFFLVVPLGIAAATGFAAGPVGEDPVVAPLEPEDSHVRPSLYDEPALADELIPKPSEAPAEYPLAISFNPADPSNYTAGGMISYDYVVVHTMQGSYYGSQSWFQNPAANVSAHFCMRSEDGEVTQMVKLADRAWHVGSSNPYAIGIEHEGFIDEPAWYTWENYLGSARLARWLSDELEIPRDRDHIVGHVELPNQTHTDPGIHWNWDIYMALIDDTVSEATIEGSVVDRGQACTLTATSDTWIKTTLEASADLDDTQKCFIPAGTTLDYLHASPVLAGHHRISYDAAGHPCEGFLGLEEQGFMFPGHFSPMCDATKIAVAGIEVTLDGGAVTVTDAEGKFRFEGVTPGSHTLDVVGGEGWYDGVEPVDVDVFPGARVLVALDPLPTPGDGDGDGSEETGGECWIGALDCPCTPGGGCDPGLVCEVGVCVPDGSGDTGDTGTGGVGGVPGARGDDGGCTIVAPSSAGGGLGGLGLLGLLGLGWARRRRAS